MAFSPDPFVAQRTPALATDSIQTVTTPPYDNTSSIILLNEDATDAVYVQWGDSGAGGALAQASSLLLPGGASVTLSIGTSSVRGQANAGNTLCFTSVAGDPIVNVTFIQTNVA
jgi:hypothetical protein